MGRTDQLVRYSDGRYLTFDPAEVAGCSAAPYATDTRQSAQLHSLRASRLSPPTPPHYARACVLRWDVWMMRSSQTSTYCACAGGRGAEADLRHVSVSERPTTDIRETVRFQLPGSGCPCLPLRYVGSIFYQRFQALRSLVHIGAQSRASA